MFPKVFMLYITGGMALAIIVIPLIMWCYKSLPEDDLDFDLDYSEDGSQFEHTIHDVDVDLETKPGDNPGVDYPDDFDDNKIDSDRDSKKGVLNNIYQFKEAPFDKY